MSAIPEARLARDRLVALAALLLVAALAWAYLWREAAMMASPGGMPMGAPGPWSPGQIGMTLLMWSVMMVGMMLPSAIPTVLLYGAMSRHDAPGGVTLTNVWFFVTGYLLAWTGFSALATLLQSALQAQGLLTGSMASASGWLSSAILVAAGLYQWLPVKRVCLEKCRHPIQFLMMRWRPGNPGALRMGLEHGWFCVGCCWVLMLVLFVAGVMNLLWVALIAAFVFAEKALPAGRLATHLAGAGLLAAGLAVAFLG